MSLLDRALQIVKDKWRGGVARQSTFVIPYLLLGLDANSITWEATLDNTGADPTDVADFNANVLPLCNKQQGSPMAPFGIPDFNFKGGGMQFMASSGTATSSYYKITSSTTLGLSIVGGNLYTQNMTMGDTVGIKVVDVDGIMSPPGTPIVSYVTGWNVSPKGDQGINTPYAIYVPGGLYIDLTYNSVSTTTPVSVGLNLFLHQAK